MYGGSGANTSFSILADAAKANASQLLLTDGVPQMGVLPQGEIQLYYAIVRVAPTTTYSVTLNPAGTTKIDLYVTTDGSRPSETNYQFGSRGVNGPEQVTISPGMPGYNSSCILRAAVHHPWIDWANFDITYEAAAVTTLLPGIPTTGNTQTAMVRYYQLPVSAPPVELVDVAFTGTTGAPEVYVGIAPVGNATWRPSRNDSCYTGVGLWQTLRVGAGDACACPVGPAGRPSPRCVYIVAIACPGTPYGDPTCRFTLVASAGSANEPVVLTDGV